MTRDDMKQGIIESFQIKGKPEAEKIKEVLIWEYDGDGYSMTAFVLFIGTDDKLYEVHGSHCSCYGLEDQWYPEETTAKLLQYSIDNNKKYGIGYEFNYREQLIELIKNKRI